MDSALGRITSKGASIAAARSVSPAGQLPTSHRVFSPNRKCHAACPSRDNRKVAVNPSPLSLQPTILRVSLHLQFMSLHQYTYLAQTGSQIPLATLTCRSLLQARPHTLHSLDADHRPPPPFSHSFNTHLTTSYCDGLNSIEQRHFPTGAIVGSLEDIGKLRSLAFRARDGVFGASIQHFRGGGVVWHGQYTLSGPMFLAVPLPVVAQSLALSDDHRFVVAIDADLLLYTRNEHSIVDQAVMEGKSYKRIASTGWLNTNTVVYGESTGEVCAWDIRERDGKRAFAATPERQPVSRLRVEAGEVFVAVDYANRRRLAAWDLRKPDEPVREYSVPWMMGRVWFDVATDWGILVGGLGNEVWVWDCWRGGRVVGGWKLGDEAVRRLKMVGWCGERGGVFVETDCESYYIVMGGLGVCKGDIGLKSDDDTDNWRSSGSGVRDLGSLDVS